MFFKDATIQSPKKPGLNAVSNLIWTSDWSRCVSRLFPKRVLLWVDDSCTCADL